MNSDCRYCAWETNLPERQRTWKVFRLKTSAWTVFADIVHEKQISQKDSGHGKVFRLKTSACAWNIIADIVHEKQMSQKRQRTWKKSLGLKLRPEHELWLQIFCMRRQTEYRTSFYCIWCINFLCCIQNTFYNSSIWF
jgi:hypothetical protein